MFHLISPTKNPVNNSLKILSPNKRSAFSEMKDLEKNVENYANKKMKTDGESPFKAPITNRDSFQAKKIDFSNENLSSQDIFTPSAKSMGLSIYLQQSASNDGIESLVSDETSGSHNSFNIRPQLIHEPQSQEKSAYEKLYLSDNREIINEIYGIKTTLLCMDKGQGSVMKAYDVTANSQLWIGIENSNILVKLYMLNILKGKVSKMQVEKVSCMMDTAIQSYKKAQKLSIPQAIIYNVETATKDCFLVVEKIRDELDISCSNQKEQVKNLFKIYFEKQIVLDLTPANLRVKTDKSTKTKTVVLVDYMETNKDNKRIPFFVDVLRRWYKTIYKESFDLSDDKRKNKAITLIKDLTEGLEVYGFDPQSINELQ